jgi:protein-tyrosine phosphatase
MDRRTFLAATASLGLAAATGLDPAEAATKPGNFRDVAGTTGLRHGVLYRSARPTGSQAAYLKSLHLAAVIDLSSGSNPDLGVPVYRYEIKQQSDKLKTYRSYVTSASNRAAVGHALTRIAHADGPVLLHCAQGKDRTGFVVACILSHCLVPPAEVEAEYVASSRFGPDVDLKWLRTALTEARSRYKTVGGYLRAAGVRQADLDLVRRRMGFQG